MIDAMAIFFNMAIQHCRICMHAEIVSSRMNIQAILQHQLYQLQFARGLLREIFLRHLLAMNQVPLRASIFIPSSTLTFALRNI